MEGGKNVHSLFVLFVELINNFPCVHRCTVPKKFSVFCCLLMLSLAYDLPKKNYIKKWFQSILNQIGEYESYEMDEKYE